VSDFDRPDPEKDRLNIAQHGMSLHEAERFDFDTAEIEDDTPRTVRRTALSRHRPTA
jgi:uncharacterized DUF497 family protein